MQISTRQGSVDQLQETLFDLRDQLVGGLSSPERPDYIRLAEVKKAYEYNLANPKNRAALREIRLRGDAAKDVDPAFSERVAGLSTAAIRATVGSRYDFDTRENTASWASVNFGLTDEQALAYETAKTRPADARADQVELANVVDTLKASAGNNAEIKFGVDRYQKARARPDLLGGLDSFTAFKIFGMQEISQGAVGIQDIRPVLDQVKHSLSVDGSNLTPDEANRRAVTTLSSALNAAGIQKAPYLLQGARLALEADPAAADTPASMRILLDKTAAWASTSEHEKVARRAALAQHLTPEETEEVVTAAAKLSLSSAGVLRASSPHVVAANNTIDTYFPNNSTTSGFATSLSREGVDPITRNVLRAARVKDVSQLPAGTPALLEGLVKTAVSTATLARKFPEETLKRTLPKLGTTPVKDIMDAFSSDDTGAYTVNDYQKQLVVLKEMRRAAPADSVGIPKLDEWITRLEDLKTSADKKGYPDAQSAVEAIASRGRMGTTRVVGKLVSLKEQVAAALEDVYAETTGSIGSAFLGVGPASQERANLRRDQIVESKTINVGGKAVPLSRFIYPVAGEGDWATDTGNTGYGVGRYLLDKFMDLGEVGIPKNAEAIRGAANTFASEVINKLLISEELSFDHKQGAFTLSDIPVIGKKEAKANARVSGTDVTGRAGAAALLEELTGKDITAANVTDYASLRANEKKLDEGVSAIGGLLGDPGFTKATLFTGVTGGAAESLVANSSGYNQALKGSSGKEAYVASRTALADANALKARSEIVFRNREIALEERKQEVLANKALSKEQADAALAPINVELIKAKTRYMDAQTASKQLTSL